MAQLTRTQIAILVGLVLAICSLSVVIGFLVIDTFFLNPPRRPTPTASGESSWSNVQKAGKIVVGTSADYAPFEYYTPDFKMDGFDIALMREMATTMGVQVEFRDMAFDGLLSALQLGQVDAVISAVSVTPERQASNDFTVVYWNGSDAALVNADSTIVLTTLDDLAKYKIGVQSGSVYENAVNEKLVHTGKMPASQLFSYPLTEQAVQGLKTGQIDVMLLDTQAAQNFANQGGVKLAAQNLNRQQYAIAVKKGANSLRDQLNTALIQAQNTGKVNLLSQQYLGVAPPPPGQPTPTPPPAPTPTPVPPVQPTAAPPPPCIDGMTFVADLTFPDFNMTAPQLINPNTPFQKGWRLRNSGTCTWTPGYVLSYANGNSPYSSMNGQPTAVNTQVPPGATFDMFVNLVSPPYPGTYQGFWVLKNTAGQAFGQRIWVGIQVAQTAPPTVPPPPTAPPGTTIIFNAQPTSIRAGQQVVFTWQVTNAQAVSFYADGDLAAQRTTQNFSGQAIEFPMVSTTYNLLVVQNNGQTQLRQIPIFVQGAPTSPPVISRFVLSPSQVLLGQCVTVDWRVDGQVQTIEITRDGFPVVQTAPLAGKVSDCPPNPGTANYSIRATGPGGTAQKAQQVQVVTAQPTPPGPLPPPVIDFFNLTPTMIMMGECVQLNWNVTGGPTSIVLARDGQQIGTSLDPTGSQTDCPGYGGSILYILTASGPGGASSSSQMLQVAEPR